MESKFYSTAFSVRFFVFSALEFRGISVFMTLLNCSLHVCSIRMHSIHHTVLLGPGMNVNDNIDIKIIECSC